MIDQEQLDSELRDAEALQTEQMKQRKARHALNKKNFRFVKRALAPAKRSLDDRGWPDSSEEVVESSSLWRRSQKIRLVLLVGQPFDGSLGSIPEDESEQPIWFGEDGKLYQLDMVMFKHYPKPGSPAITPLDLRYVSLHDNWQDVASALQRIADQQ